MKIAIVLLTALAFTGCGWVDLLEATATGYSKVCVDGVEYLQFTSGVTVAYALDGKVKACAK